MRRTWITLAVLALLALPAFADDDVRTPAEVAELATGVKHYPTKFKLIAMGRAALKPLMAQLESKDKWLVFESASAVRWIAHHALRDGGAKEIAADLATFLHPDPGVARQQALAVELLGDLGASDHVDEVWATFVTVDHQGPVFAAAYSTLVRLPGEAVTKRLMKLAGEASLKYRGVMYLLLAERGDPAGAGPVLKAARAGDAQAIGALGLGDGFAEAAPLLLELHRAKNASAFTPFLAVARKQGRADLLVEAYGASTTLEERVPIIRTMAHVPPGETGVVSLLLDAMKKDLLRVPAQHALLNIAGRPGWQHPEVYRSVLAASENEAVTLRALAGLGRVGDEDALDLVVPYLTSDKPALRTTALAAIAGISGQRATETLIQALTKSADAAEQSLLIRALQERGDTQAMGALSAFMLAHQSEMRRQAGEALIALADKGGIDEARKVHHQLLEAGVQMAALRGLARTGDATSIERIAPFKGAASAELTDRASQALVAIGDRLAKTDKPNAIKAYRAALDFGVLVENKLRLLGESIEITARGGRLSAWWIAGPFKADQAAWAKQEIDPKTVNLDEQLLSDGGSEQRDSERLWKPVQVGGEDAIVDLDSLLSPNDGVVAYAFAEVHVKKARKVVFKGGSDDGLRVWVNGKLVHTVFEPRGITVDGDTFEAELEEGRNEILVKVCEIGGGWGFCLRLETEKGRPLKFKIR